MGLSEPDIDLEELIDKDGDSSDSGKDVSEMSKKELFKKVQKEGQINLGNNRALISCPCTRGTLLGNAKTKFMCALSMRPDPVDGKQKPVCSGPIIGMKYLHGESKSWKNGHSASSNCPYSPHRFQQGEEDDL